MREYQTVMQDHLTARLIAAILHKLGETSITISTEDLKSLPPGHVESYGDPFDGTMTYRFRKYDHADPDQQELPLADNPQVCGVAQYSDRMSCQCGVEYDTNDPAPPVCPRTNERLP